MKTMLRAAIMVFSIGISSLCRQWRRIRRNNTVHIDARSAVLSAGDCTWAGDDYYPERRRGARPRDHQPRQHLAVPAGPEQRRTLTTPAPRRKCYSFAS